MEPALLQLLHHRRRLHQPMHSVNVTVKAVRTLLIRTHLHPVIRSTQTGPLNPPRMVLLPYNLRLLKHYSKVYHSKKPPLCGHHHHHHHHTLIRLLMVPTTMSILTTNHTPYPQRAYPQRWNPSHTKRMIAVTTMLTLHHHHHHHHLNNHSKSNIKRKTTVVGTVVHHRKHQVNPSTAIMR